MFSNGKTIWGTGNSERPLSRERNELLIQEWGCILEAILCSEKAILKDYIRYDALYTISSKRPSYGDGRQISGC